MIAFMERGRRVGVLLTALGLSLSVPLSARAQGTLRGVPPGVEHRVAAFLTAVADSAASFAGRSQEWVGQRGPGATQLSFFAYGYTDVGEMGMRGRRVSRRGIDIDPLVRLDSIRALWAQTSTADQAAWLYTDGGCGYLVRTLAPLVSHGALVAPAAQLADAMRRGAEVLRHGATASSEGSSPAMIANAEAQLLESIVQLTRGDTVAAMRTLLAVALASNTSAAFRAAGTLAAVATAHHDAAMQLRATTLAYLMNAGTDTARKRRDYQTLRTIYPAYTRAHGPAPDVMPGVMRDVPVPATPLALDAYLDRQFGVLYDRAFPVTPATGRAPRVVVLEYATGVFCGPCWIEDRAFSAVSRRYPADQVIPLAYHMHFPIARIADGLWSRLIGTWYPYPYSFGRTSTAHPSVIPVRTAISPRGDTLDQKWVDGIGLPYRAPTAGQTAPEVLFQSASAAIDSELRRPPAARLRLRVARDGGRVVATTTIDSIPGHRARLAFRAVLVQDTVTLRGGTNRRVYTNVVRAAAYTDSLPLGLPLATTDSATTIVYAFDVDQLNRDLQTQRDPAASVFTLAKEDIVAMFAPFPDARDWHVDPDRLFVVVFVQDLDTSEVLQAATMRVPRRH